MCNTQNELDCVYNKPFVHLALVSADHKSWVCSEDVSVIGTFTHKQKLWLPVQADLETGWYFIVLHYTAWPGSIYRIYIRQYIHNHC